MWEIKEIVDKYNKMKAINKIEKWAETLSLGFQEF
jgi:hypothetical protein